MGPIRYQLNISGTKMDVGRQAPLDKYLEHHYLMGSVRMETPLGEI